MKKFKSLVYVLALALIFVGAASVTKAAATDGDNGNTVTWAVPDAGVTSVTVTYGGTSAQVTSGETLIAKDAVVTVAYVAAEGYTVTVESENATLTLTDGKAEYTFAMPENAVTLTINAVADNVAGGDDDGGDDDGGDDDENSATPTPNPGASAISASADYATERIVVTSDKQVYYQIVKTADTKTGLKTANWIKAAVQDGKYYIDFSGTANSKDAFFALTTDNTKDAASVVAKVDAVIKSVKVGLNYKTETISAENGLADVIATLNVKGIDKGDENADGTAAEYQLKWKRGANGTWAGKTAFTQLEWDMLKASNGTLYVAIDGKVASEGTTLFRMSKEAKVKIPKSAKAPTVKVDYVKGTIGLKNGMQVRVNAGTDWMDIIAYDKENKSTDVFALATANAKTGKKVSTVSVADFVAAVKNDAILDQDDDVVAGAAVTLTVRTAATEKKFPSMEGTVKVVLPKAAPAKKSDTAVALSYTVADKANKINAAYEINFANLFTLPDGNSYNQYEYMFVGNKADGTNLAKQKWTKLTETGKVDLAKYIGKDYKYFKASDESKSSGVVKYEAIKAVYIRLAAVKATKEVTGVFASDYVTVEVAPTATAAVVSPTPTPTGTPDAGEDENQQEPEVTDYALTSASGNAAVATFKVGDTAVTRAAKDATVEIVYEATTGNEIASVTYTVEGNETPVPVEASLEGKYIFTMPEGNVTVTITEQAVTPADPGAGE